MAKTKPKTSWLSFFDRYGLLVLSTFLIAFIPLYPKLPLFDLIEGYIVRVRLEDVLIAFTLLVYFVQLIRKKVTFNSKLTRLIVAYTLVGFFSVLSGIFLTQTIPTTQEHILKSTLHFFRYIEYFSLFFIFYSSVKSKKDLQIALSTLVLTVLAVGIYGLGQKYLYWPVYSTMNREFSKGITLYLTEHARVQSTFAGHYDMAAYLVIVLPLLLTLSFLKLKVRQKIIIWSAFVLGLLMMILSASRTSLAGLLLGIGLVITLASFLEKTWQDKVVFFLKQSLTTGMLFLFLFFSFGDNMAERLAQTLESYAPLAAVISEITDQKEALLQHLESNQFVSQIPKAEKPSNGLSTDQAAVLVASDTRPTPIKPSDVYVDVPDKIEVATVSADGTTSRIVIEVPRTYSENALKHGLSLAIRLDTLWPQALQGFYTNPLLGTGYATLTKSSVNEFTEADSTDNNFLRTLGETGLLGFITFYGVIIVALSSCVQAIRKKTSDSLQKMLAIGFIGGTIGLFVNAIFIDVFAASKVAYTYWALTGLILAYFQHVETHKNRRKKSNRKKNSQSKTFKNI